MVDSPKHDPGALVILGIPFHDVTMAETLDWIDEAIARKDSTYLVTANLDFATQASEDIELQRILAEADLVLCDGTPLIWASRLAGTPLRERVAGSDLVPKIAKRAEEKGHRIFLLGGEPQILERAAAKLGQQYPKLPRVGFYSPPFAPLHEFDHEQVKDVVKKATPDILLVAFGCPKQEKWIYMNYRKLGVPCAIGVGATVDFLAGKVSRAPPWVAKAGLEWVYRMVQEPKRLSKRYAKDLLFLLRQSWRERNLPTLSRDTEVSSENSPKVESMLSWRGRLCAGEDLAFPEIAPENSLALNLAEVTAIDRTGLGKLLQMARIFWREGIGFCLLAPSSPVRTALSATGLSRLFDVAEDAATAKKMMQFSAALHRLRPLAEPDGILSFRLPERLTAANAEGCGAVIESEWNTVRTALVLHLDCREVRFMDSSGLGMIIRCRKTVDTRANGKLKMANVGDSVKNVIHLARLEKTLLWEGSKNTY